MGIQDPYKQTQFNTLEYIRQASLKEFLKWNQSAFPLFCLALTIIVKADKWLFDQIMGSLTYLINLDILTYIIILEGITYMSF